MTGYCVCCAAAVQRVADAGLQVLQETAEKGFQQEQLMAIMHQVCVSSLQHTRTRNLIASMV